MPRWLIVAAIMVSVALSVNAQDPQIVIPSGFLVTDSQGAEVGLVLDLYPALRVALVVDGISLVSNVESTGLISLGYAVWFATPDCSGTAYVGPLLGTMLDDTGGVVAGPAWTVYRFIGPIPDPPVQLQSTNSFSFDGSCIQYKSTSQPNQRPAVRVVDLRSLFVPPFKIEPFSIDLAHCVRRKLPRAT